MFAYDSGQMVPMQYLFLEITDPVENEIIKN